ncbi:MAG: PP0621 family protein [Ramlibacter sp.]
MKYLVLIAVVALAWIYWRSKRGNGEAPPGPQAGVRPDAPAALPEDMVRCPVCALHLPRAEATAGAQGRLYCSHEHLLADAEKSRR